MSPIHIAALSPLLDRWDNPIRNKLILLLISATISKAYREYWVNFKMFSWTLSDSFLRIRNSHTVATLNSQGKKHPKKASSNIKQVKISAQSALPFLPQSNHVLDTFFNWYATSSTRSTSITYMTLNTSCYFSIKFFWILSCAWTSETWRFHPQEFSDHRSINFFLSSPSSLFPNLVGHNLT